MQNKNALHWYLFTHTHILVIFELSIEVDKVFKVGQIKAEYDDKLFAETKTTLRDNIYSQANNIPAQLVKAESSIFGTQSETYLEMKNSRLVLI